LASQSRDLGVATLGGLAQGSFSGIAGFPEIPKGLTPHLERLVPQVSDGILDRVRRILGPNIRHGDKQREHG
jgi:hypothetical protein